MGSDDARDGQLVAAAKHGDARALDELLERHEARVLRLVRLLGVPSADREDVAQEIFVRVFRHLRGFRPGHAFGAWLYRIAVNACHDYRRHTHRRRGTEVAWEGAGEDPADRSPGPEELAEQEHRRRRLERALEALSERERAVFVLCELEQLETREVAKSLSISAITVRRHLSRARARLVRVLEREPPSDG